MADTAFSVVFVEVDIPGFVDPAIAQTLRFAMPSAYLPDDIDAIPSIVDIDYSPATISLGKDLGTRANVSISFKDHKHIFANEPYDSGTFWGKFRARYGLTLRGQSLRLRQGFLGQTLQEMEEHHFIIDSNNGPDPQSGVFEFVAKDFLKLADPDRAQAPTLSNGFLSVAINSSVTAATLSPSGIGNSEYPASGHINIGGQEIVSFTRTNDALTIVRAQRDTVAASHSAEDRCQLALTYDAQDPADIIFDLLNTYAGVDSAYLPLVDWTTETDAFLSRLYSATIPEPTAVSVLVSELIEQAALAVWWNEISREVNLRVLRAIPVDAVTYDEGVIIKDSLTIEEQPETRLTKVWIYFGLVNPLQGLSDPDNFRSSSETADLSAEIEFGSPAIKKIFSRWIPKLGRSVASRVGDIQIARFNTPPRTVQFDLLKPNSTIMLGGGYRLKGWPVQRTDGTPASIPVQVTRLETLADRYRVTADEMLFTDLADDIPTIIVDVDTNDINMRTVYDQLFSAPEDGDTVILIVNAGVIVGSSSTSTPALDIGSWPAGVEIIVHCLGRIEGKGGAGGDGGNASPDVAGKNGLPGGDALLTTVPINLDVSAGEIFSGGGGSGGGGGNGTFNYGGGGGGGGAGRDGGESSAGGQVPSSADGQQGAAGTPDAGGAGGDGFEQPVGVNGGDGGDGGGPGLPGVSGTHASNDSTGIGSGAAEGNSIDGTTDVTKGVWDGTVFTPGVTGGEDIRGPEVN